MPANTKERVIIPVAAVLEIKGLQKSFGKKKIIDDLTFTVNEGEVFGFLGPNGAGKTTTIKVIMGFLSMDAGSIAIAGQDIKKNYEKAMACVGGIVENPEVYKELSGMTNLEMYARLHPGVTKERIMEMVNLVGMQNRIHDKVKKYSLGMKQRLGVAQALLHKPRLLILDEPTNGLDPKGIKELRDILINLAHKDNVGVFVSSHLLSEMELMCDRVGIIVNGRFLGVRTIEELHKAASGQDVYVLRVSNVEKALSLLTEKGWQAQVGSTAQTLSVYIAEAEIPSLLRHLLGAGIDVYAAAKAERSLEEAFMELTGGEGIA